MHVLDNAHPYLASFEITKNCNYRCVFCYQSDRIRSAEKDVPRSEIVRGITPASVQPEMSVDEIREHIIPQVSEMQFKSFCFLGAEPLLRFDDIIELAPALKKIKGTLKDIQISTNGYLLDEKKIDRLRDAYRDFMITLAIPLDTTTQSIAVQLRPPKPDAMARAIEAMKLAVRKGFYIGSEMVVNKLNFHEIDAVEKKLKEIAKDKIFQEVYPMFRFGTANSHLDICLDDDQVRFIDKYKIEKYGDRVLMWDSMPFPVDEKTWNKVKKHAFESDISRGCSAGVNYFNIDHAGNVYPCNFLGNTYLGNLLDDPHAFVKIWNEHPIVQKLRNREITGKCGSCKYRVNCGGCRSRAFIESGDIFGGVGSCDGGPSGHPLEKVMSKNLLRSYRKYYPMLVAYRAMKKIGLMR
jgi:radical SAM protein with 4Fe4S-binding SPASM domain